MDCLKSVVDIDNQSGIFVESCTRSKNQGIPAQPGAIRMARQLLYLILDHLVKESHGRLSISSEN